MAKLLLNLRMVPDDEAEDVRAFLREHAIAFHETRPSPWGISYGGIWLDDAADHPRARKLMDEYQAVRRARARESHAASVRDGSAETFGDVLRREPLRVLLVAVAIAFLLALVALPVVLLR